MHDISVDAPKTEDLRPHDTELYIEESIFDNKKNGKVKILDEK